MKSPHNTNLCPVCESTGVQKILTIRNVPAHCCILWETREEAIQCEKGDIHLTFCDHCGHLYNPSFNEKKMAYSENYENSLHFSNRFQEYSMELVERLCNTYDLYQKDILEIGCGKGDFLKMICGYGNSRGYGFDKSYEPQLDERCYQYTVKFIQDFYSDKYAGYPADLLVTRYVLEHIKDPCHFISDIKNIAVNGQEVIFYFEVPNILYTLRDKGIWDLIYEHCSYFSGPSLAKLFQKLDFSIINVAESYMGQFLYIEASTQNHTEKPYSPYIRVDSIRKLVEDFAYVFNEKVNHWKNTLRNLQLENKNIVAWGGGAKGVSFLNFLNTSEIIRHIVDINPRKEGKFIAGSGQEYIMPEALKNLDPDVVIIMNPIYSKEISKTLSEMNLSPQIMVA